MDFKDLAELEAHFNKVALQALQTTVLEKIKDIMVEEIETEVYEAYESNAKIPYQRTGKLKNRNNIKGYIVNGKMMVINERGYNRKNGMDIGTILETGKGYTWEESEIYGAMPFPRPFYKTTTYRIKGKNLKDIINALKIGLKVGGLELK